MRLLLAALAALVILAGAVWLWHDSTPAPVLFPPPSSCAAGYHVARVGQWQSPSGPVPVVGCTRAIP